MKRYKIIYNPSSGKEEAANKAFQVSRLIMDTEDVEFTFCATKGKNDACKKAFYAAEDGYDVIISCGGDGTVHEIVNGMLKSSNKVKLSILPAGTVNDFAVQLKIPKSPHKFSKMLIKENCKLIDVGIINNRYFVNVVFGGSFSSVPHSVTIEEKTMFGRFAYYFRALLEIPEQLMRTYEIDYNIDGINYSLNSHLFLVNNTLGAGGFKLLCPDAKIDDGLLDILIFEKSTHAELLQIFTSVFNGHHIQHPKVHYFQAKNIVINSKDKDLVIDSDGELLKDMPLHITTCDNGLNLIIP